MQGPDPSKTPEGKVAPLIAPGMTYASAATHLASLVVQRPVTPGWLMLAGFTGLLVAILFGVVVGLFKVGIGIWGVNIPVAWGFAIANFVWWIGIGHAGTLISAFLWLMRQKWRTSINRFAEAMTIFAVVCAGLFPLLHLGRPWFFYFLVPYPNHMWLWPQWRSALVWDIFAVSTYLTVSLLFWYLGMVPDLATLRDHAPRRWQQVAFGVLALGWRGSVVHWHRYRMAYTLLAGLATPLVISVHSVVSLDFTTTLVRGWHATFFPPYFVAGALFSGFAMVLTLTIPIRKVYNLEGLVTLRHIDLLAKMLLATGLIVDYAYAMEVFMAWYSGDPYEWATTMDRLVGPYAYLWWLVVFCNVVTIQALWFRNVRTHLGAVFVISLLTNFGMWCERVMIVIQSLQHDFLPSRQAMYYPTLFDWLALFGTLGLFTFLFLMFLRFLPMMSISEVQHLVRETREAEAV